MLELGEYFVMKRFSILVILASISATTFAQGGAVSAGGGSAEKKAATMAGSLNKSVSTGTLPPHTGTPSIYGSNSGYGTTPPVVSEPPPPPPKPQPPQGSGTGEHGVGHKTYANP